MQTVGKVGLGGGVKIEKFPQTVPLTWRVPNYLKKVLPGEIKDWFVTQVLGMNHMCGRLRLKQYRQGLLYKDFGLVSTRVVTNAFVNYMVDQMQAEDSEWGDFKYHEAGTTNTAEAAGDTALAAPVESRATGSQEEGGAANIYRSIGTISFTGTRAVVEWGVFNNATGITLLDRTVFTAVNVENGDSIVGTYDLTCTAGG
jgi:hypothetical protein